MTREISPKRDTKTGFLYHSCPAIGMVVGLDACEDCTDAARIEYKPSRYVVYCNFPVEGAQLRQFDPPKAHDTYRGLKGLDTSQSPVHMWVEPKLDGVRALVHCTPAGVFITSRRRDKSGQFNQFQDNVPHLRDHQGLKRVGATGYTILDGEIIAPGACDTLARTMSIVGSKPDRAIAVQDEGGKAVLHIFDMPYVFGEDLTSCSLLDRHVALVALHVEVISIAGFTCIVPHKVLGTAKERLARTTAYMQEGFEGSVVKDPSAGYFQPQAWLKVKGCVTVDALVTGWELGTVGGKYENTLGALRVSIRGRDGHLHEIAKVTPGDDATRERLYSRLLALDDCTILGIVVEMEAQMWTKDRRLRHPRILRYRPDLSEPNTLEWFRLG